MPLNNNSRKGTANQVPFFFKQIRPAAGAGLLVLLVVITSCQAHNHKIQPGRDPIPDLQNVTLRMKDLAGNTTRLVNGEFRGDHLHVGVLRTATADLNQDGFVDGVIIVRMNSGGSGSFRVLCLLINDGKKMVNSDEAHLGDRIKIKNLEIEGNTITVNYLDRAREDSYSVDPYIKKRVQYRVRGMKLERLITDQDKPRAGQSG